MGVATEDISANPLNDFQVAEFQDRLRTIAHVLGNRSTQTLRRYTLTTDTFAGAGVRVMVEYHEYQHPVHSGDHSEMRAEKATEYLLYSSDGGKFLYEAYCNGILPEPVQSDLTARVKELYGHAAQIPRNLLQNQINL